MKYTLRIVPIIKNFSTGDLVIDAKTNSVCRLSDKDGLYTPIDIVVTSNEQPASGDPIVVCNLKDGEKIMMYCTDPDMFPANTFKIVIPNEHISKQTIEDVIHGELRDGDEVEVKWNSSDLPALITKPKSDPFSKEASQIIELARERGFVCFSSNYNEIFSQSIGFNRGYEQALNPGYTDYFMNEQNCIARLFAEWEKYGSLIIAFDFDNTVFDFYRAGHTFKQTIELLRECHKMGFRLTLFTSCNDDRMEEIKSYLKENDIPYDGINDTPEYIPFNGRKIYFNHFLDDRASLGSAYRILKETIFRIKMKIRSEKIKTDQDIDF